MFYLLVWHLAVKLMELSTNMNTIIWIKTVVIA